MTTFQKFLKQNIDLSALGIDRGAENCAYFCTPKGASMIGWTGVDGIHYCFIRGFGEMVFAVSPTNLPGEYVHPVAENFADFLRLLLACGGEAALEQAWAWTQEQFEAFLLENPVTEEQQKVLDMIGNQMGLIPMDDPFSYIKKVQAGFDYSKIKYTEDLNDPDMNPSAKRKAPEWKVYFDGNFWGHHADREHAGKEISIGKWFQWGGRQWLIPAVYSCSKGLVMDFCMRIEPEKIQAFMKKWNLNIENDSHLHFTKEQQMEMELDNPLCCNFRPRLLLNGDELITTHGCGTSYNPCLAEDAANELEAQWIIEHYDLDISYGWMIWRSAFPWKTKRRPEIQTLSVTLEQDLVPLPGPRFQPTAPDDRFDFVHPVTGQTHTLAVREYEQQELPSNSFSHMPAMEFPTHLTAMSYTVTPDLPDTAFAVKDCAEGDRPRQKPHDPMKPQAVNDALCIGIIGGFTPIATSFNQDGQGKLHSVCSSLHFEPADTVEWRIVFYEKQLEDIVVELRQPPLSEKGDK